jgi:hypothetical protein
MEIQTLFNEEIVRHNGANLRVVLTHADLTETTDDTDQTIELFDVADKMAVRLVKCKLVTPFEDASDAALNDTQISVGDGSDPDRYLGATQVNENGTEVDLKVPASAVPSDLTASDPAAVTASDPAACAALTTDLTGVDTGTDMTDSQAGQIEADLAALKAAIDGNNAEIDALIDDVTAVRAEVVKLVDDVATLQAQTEWHVYTGDDTVDAVVESMSAKALNDIDTGEIHLYFAVDQN